MNDGFALLSPGSIEEAHDCALIAQAATPESRVPFLHFFRRISWLAYCQSNGTYPSGTSAFEKRDIADVVPVWKPDLCVQCGQCNFVCPHAAIRAKYFDKTKLIMRPRLSNPLRSMSAASPMLVLSCRFMPKIAPVGDEAWYYVLKLARPTTTFIRRSKPSIFMTSCRSSKPDAVIGFLRTAAGNDRARVDFANVRGVQFLQPLFEFSGACAGCGETRYLKLLSQLFGDRMQVAHATGCSQPAGDTLDKEPRRTRIGLVEFLV